MQILLCIGELYYRFKQNVPASESRQFDRLRLRLRLQARCHDTGRLRLQLRIRTPESDPMVTALPELALAPSYASFPAAGPRAHFFVVTLLATAHPVEKLAGKHIITSGERNAERSSFVHNEQK